MWDTCITGDLKHSARYVGADADLAQHDIFNLAVFSSHAPAPTPHPPTHPIKKGMEDERKYHFYVVL